MFIIIQYIITLSTLIVSLSFDIHILTIYFKITDVCPNTPNQ